MEKCDYCKYQSDYLCLNCHDKRTKALRKENKDLIEFCKRKLNEYNATPCEWEAFGALLGDDSYGK